MSNSSGVATCNKAIDAIKNASNFNKLSSFLAPFILYLIVDLIYFFNWHKFLALNLFNPSSDPLTYIWALNWWPWAILHGINPFITHYIWAPNGLNLTWAVSIPALAIIASPMIIVFGPIITYNIFAILALPLAAYSTFLLLRYITKDFFASFVGGYLFGFSSYEIGQFLGHINLFFSFIIPLLVLLVIKRYYKEINRFPFIILFALAITLEVGISSEIAFTATFFGFISIIIFYLFANKDIRYQIFKLGLDVVFAYLLATVLLSPFLYYFMLGFNQAPKVINSPSFYSADLLNYIIPTPVTRFGRIIFENIASRFTGNYSEEGAYLGIILVIVAIFSIKEQLKNWRGKAILIILLVVFFSSLGPYLHINGVNTKIPLLWRLFVNLPIFRDALPARFTLYVFLMVSLIIALWLSKPEISKKNKMYRYIIVFFGLIMLLPNTKMWHWGAVKTPVFFKNKKIMRKFINKGDNILVFPYNNGGLMDYYQMKSKMYFKMPEGYIGFVPKVFIKSPVFNMFNSNSVSPNYKLDKLEIFAFICSHDVKDIVLAPGTSNIWCYIFNNMKWKRIKTGGVTLYKVPEVVFQKYKHITISQVNQKTFLSTFNSLYNSSMKFLKDNKSLSNLYPKYLENRK